MKQLLLSLILLSSLISFSQNRETLDSHFNLNRKKVAIKGYDPVSYFNLKPLKGEPDIRFKFQGTIYYFQNLKNKNTFIESPTSYMPQYGGWCAFAMGDTGEEVDINPVTFKIIDGKLYLFYNKFFNNTLTYWNENENKLKVQADKNWGMIVKKND